MDRSRSSLQHLKLLQSMLAGSGSCKDDLAKQLAELRSVYSWMVRILGEDIQDSICCPAATLLLMELYHTTG